ncbi:hypothetical protein [Klebsiella pneumoniae]|uniref:hypothetical protein n=1 Tax=Klebsiella pneumoniae TaxID=573 RepID=UPI001CEDAF9C|nr:hypothetical protein [Klebsiella pneumoniae]
MTQSEITVNSFWDWGTSLLTSNGAVIFYALLVVLVLGAVLFKDFSLLTTFASGLAGIALLCGVMSVLVVLVLASDQKEQDWQDFAAEHCKVIEKREGGYHDGSGCFTKRSGRCFYWR